MFSVCVIYVLYRRGRRGVESRRQIGCWPVLDGEFHIWAQRVENYLSGLRWVKNSGRIRRVRE
jgi:hypothetical protein